MGDGSRASGSAGKRPRRGCVPGGGSLRVVLTASGRLGGARSVGRAPWPPPVLLRPEKSPCLPFACLSRGAGCAAAGSVETRCCSSDGEEPARPRQSVQKPLSLGFTDCDLTVSGSAVQGPS